ncbi:MAG: hypothetical protein ABIQ52_21930 [Vicinamibacterales bacterium]
MNRRFALIVAIAAAVVVPIATRPVIGQEGARAAAHVDPPGFGLMTIAGDQNMRVNVVNTSVPSPALPPNPCKVIIAFVDEAGSVVSGSQLVELNAGESVSSEAFGFRTGGGTLTRLRPIVRMARFSPRSPVALPPNPCLPTVEVFDAASGKTTQFVDGVGRSQTFEPLVVVDGSGDR